MMESKLLTEQRNPDTMDIDTLSTIEVLKRINAEDKKVPLTIEHILPEIAQVVEQTVDALDQGGRLIYTGAGTSGRLGILDASECPPTFSTPHGQVLATIAGGENAILKAMEGVEDDIYQAVEDAAKIDMESKDILIGIAASGQTPYTAAMMKEAKKTGAKTAAIVCSPDSLMEEIADYAIVAKVGPEVITGSTRMKAGTAQKLILNMITTTTMIRMGKTYSNLMIDVAASNNKLRERSQQIIMEATGVSEEEARQKMQEYNSVKIAILSIITGLEGEKVVKLNEKYKGHLGNAVQSYNNGNNI